MSGTDSTNAAAIEVRGLVKVFRGAFTRRKVAAVKEISFRVEPGEVYGLIGPNGSGKSTTMKALLGLVRPSAGETFMYGRSSLKTSSRHLVGFLPENPYFYKHLTGTETVSFYGKLCGLSGRGLKERVGELLELVDLKEAADRRVGGYSKGMLQRIGLAQALVHDPRLLILDEPTAGVDPTGSRRIRDLILQLKSAGKTVLLTSHLLEQVQDVCDRVGIMNQGALVKEGRLDDLIAIEDQTDIVLRNASPELVAKIRELSEKEGAEVVSTGKPRTTLEKFFLKVTGNE